MENAQKEYKTTEARRRANKNYANSKWRPNVFLDKSRQPEIEKRIAECGYKSFNEYVIALIEKDMNN